jgi:hypothetical protein
MGIWGTKYSNKKLSWLRNPQNMFSAEKICFEKKLLFSNKFIFLFLKVSSIFSEKSFLFSPPPCLLDVDSSTNRLFLFSIFTGKSSEVRIDWWTLECGCPCVAVQRLRIVHDEYPHPPLPYNLPSFHQPCIQNQSHESSAASKYARVE